MPQIVAPPENKIPEKRPIITTCSHCHYTISYTEDEVERVSDDSLGIMCPNCNELIVLEYVEPFTFPDTFYYFGQNDGAVALSNEETQHYIDIVKRKLQQECKVGEYAFTGTGDTMIFGFKFEDEDVIYVAKNYWEDR